MKKTKIIIPALGMLLLSTAASVSGTVAWFSMNTSINVTGMTVTTKVSSSLQIATANDDSLFSNDDLNQTRSAKLEPASSADGHAFFYTTNAKSNGDANADQYATYAEATTTLNAAHKTATGKDFYDKDFNETYGFAYDNTDANSEVSFAYIDYAFYLKANIIGDAQKIAMDKCNILYNNTALSTEWAWRVGLFAHQVNANVNEDNETTTGSSSNLISILSLAKSKNQNEITSTVLEADASTSGYKADPQLTQDPASNTANGTTRYYQASAENGTPKAVSVANQAPTAVQKPNAYANIASNVTGSVRYKVVVRLWLEGEDVSCTTDTFASLTNSWKLSLSFKLGGDNGVNELGSEVPAQNP